MRITPRHSLWVGTAALLGGFSVVLHATDSNTASALGSCGDMRKFVVRSIRA